MKSIKDKLEKLVGKQVFVEGTHALLIPTEGVGGPSVQAVYSPAVGLLVEVLTDGFVLQGPHGEYVIYPMANIRSVQLHQQGNEEVKKPSSLLT